MKKFLTNSESDTSYQISIIIVNYNTGHLLEECLSSIDKSTNSFKNPKVEVIVIDNASSDGSLFEIGKYDRNVKIIGNSLNVGFAKAVNQGIEVSNGENVFLLNPDCKLGLQVLEKLLEYSLKNKGIGVIGPKLLNLDGTAQSSVIPFPTIKKAIDEFWLNKKVYSKYTPHTDKPIEVDALVMAAFLITPAGLRQVGRLDEKYFMYFEDIDYCLKIHNSGLKVIYYPQVQVVHHHGVSGSYLANHANQWRRLIPSSKLYHGTIKHYIINFIIWFGSRIIHRWF